MNCAEKLLEPTIFHFFMLLILTHYSLNGQKMKYHLSFKFSVCIRRSLLVIFVYGLHIKSLVDFYSVFYVSDTIVIHYK